MALLGRSKILTILITILFVAAVLVGCAPQEAPPEQPAVDETTPAESEDADEPAVMTSITIMIPDNPVAFNGINTDTGYEQALGELVMLSLTETDPEGNIFPELAAEIPTIENGGVIFDEDTWTMTVTWKTSGRCLLGGWRAGYCR